MRCLVGSSVGRLLRVASRAVAAAGLLFGAVTVSWASEVVSTVPRLDESAALAAGQAVVGTTLPDFTLLDRRGKPVRLSQYRGKPLLVSFIYTGCFEICPTNTRMLHEAVKGLDKLLSPNQFNVISIGFNQPFDSPTAMRAFAAQHQINYANWEFLSPHASHVKDITEAFGFSYVATPAGFDHVLGVTVVDGTGKIYSQVWGDNMNPQKLGEPLRRLLGRAPLAQTDSISDLIERVRILCTVYDPETGTYSFKYALILEIIGGISFFIAMIWFFVVELLRKRRARRAARPPLLPIRPGEALR